MVQDDITRKGVVFNEMKGVYSSPDSVNQRTVQHSLFPDNTYGEDSGGDPKVIPDLTFDEFKVLLYLPASFKADISGVSSIAFLSTLCIAASCV